MIVLLGFIGVVVIAIVISYVQDGRELRRIERRYKEIVDENLKKYKE